MENKTILEYLLSDKEILEHLRGAKIEELREEAFAEHIRDCAESLRKKKTPAQIQSAAKALAAIPMENQNVARIWDTGEYLYVMSPRTVVRVRGNGIALEGSSLPVLKAAEKLFDTEQHAGETVSDIDWPFFLAEATTDFKKKKPWIGLYREGAEPYGYAVDAASLVPALTILCKPERVWTWGTERARTMRLENDSIAVVTLLKKEEKEEGDK